MSRRGRFLEILVRQLQSFLGPQGLEIKSPELFYQNGNLIAEIDVTIRGKFGSSTIFVGIECRDRPEDGPQGIPWLTQINGKQRLVKADKMIAVSTTGFTPEATTIAQEFGIDLLTLEGNTEEITLAGWFYTINFQVNEETWDISGRMKMSTEPKTAPYSVLVEHDTPFLRADAAKGLISLDEFLKPALDVLFESLPYVNSRVIKKEATIRWTGQIDAELQGVPIKITRLVIPLRLSRERRSGRLLLNKCISPDKNELVALTGSGTFQTGTNKLKVLAIAKKSPSGPQIAAIQFTFLTEDNKPFVIPKGAVFTTWQEVVAKLS